MKSSAWPIAKKMKYTTATAVGVKSASKMACVMMAMLSKKPKSKSGCLT